MNAEKIREDFPIFRERPELVYLDNAATSQKPEQVISALTDFYREKNSNTSRGLYTLANEATETYQRSRSKVAEFIGSRASETVFVKNTTEAENLVAESLDIEGDIVLSEMSHHSEQLPWRKKAESEDVEVSYIETDQGKISVEDARQKIDDDTSVVAFSHISNVFGAENPVKQLTEIAHRHNATVVLDSAQSVPHKPVDVKQLGVDFMCFSGHKMLGPSGTGVLYGKKKLLEEMDPYQVGGGMINKVTQDEVSYGEVPEKFEAGTQNVAGAVGLAAACEYLEEIGMESISRHDRALCNMMISELNEIEGVEVLSPEDATVVSFKTEFAHPHDIAEVLNQNNVAVRAGNHCAQPQMEKLGINGTTRASPYLYNTEDDVKQLIEAVREARKIFTQG